MRDAGLIEQRRQKATLKIIIVDDEHTEILRPRAVRERHFTIPYTAIITENVDARGTSGRIT